MKRQTENKYNSLRNSDRKIKLWFIWRSFSLQQCWWVTIWTSYTTISVSFDRGEYYDTHGWCDDRNNRWDIWSIGW